MTGSTAAGWRDALALFDCWLDAPPTERAALLARWQVEQPALHERLLTLMAADDAAEAEQFLAPATPVAAASPSAGQRLGAWVLREPIGSGGMGQVWLAERGDGLYSAQAAIKLLHDRPGRDRAAGQAERDRFAREGELLARLVHPHIARLLDAGITPEGARFLVLEYVAGQPLDGWCDARRLGLPERLQLFLQVCEAVAFAHAHLVVHRDLKPANILVTAEGQVKLLDFGVAKLLGDEPQDSELTRAAAAGLTPAYAAPEQLTGGAISTATDVYALGVLLFQLLSGQRPYAGSASTPADLLRDIVDAEPLSLAAVQPASQAAQARGLAPAQLAAALRSDLAPIATRALQKEPAARYASVPALADDLRRYLRCEPVSARAPNRRYQAARFVRRHRWGVTMAALLSGALGAGVAATLWQARKAGEQARVAQAEAGKATAIKDFLLKAFNTAQVGTRTQGKGADTTVLELIERGAADVMRDDKLAPEVRLELLTALGELQRINGLSAQAEPLQLKALEIARQHHGPTSEKYVYALVERATTLSNLGRRDEAGRVFDDAIAIMERAGQQATESYAFALWYGGVNAFRQSDPARALALFERAEAAARQHRPTDPVHGDALQWQANVHGLREDFTAAQAALQRALPVAKASTKPERGEAMARLYLGDLLARQGEFGAALAEYEQALRLMALIDSGRNPDRVVALANIARARHEVGQAGQADAARADARAAQDLARHHPAGTPGRRLPDRADAAMLRILLAEGEAAAALPLARDLAARWAPDARDSSRAATWALLAEAELLGGTPAAARQAAEQALALYGDAAATTLPARQARLLLAQALERQGDAVSRDAAREQLQAVLAPARVDATGRPPRARQLQKAQALAGLARLAGTADEARRLAGEGQALLGEPRYLSERRAAAALQAAAR